MENFLSLALAGKINLGSSCNKSTSRPLRKNRYFWPLIMQNKLVTLAGDVSVASASA